MSDKAASKKSFAKAEKAHTAGSPLKGLSLISLCVVMLTALLGVGYGKFIADLLRGLLGWGAYLVVILIGIQGLMVSAGYSWRDKAPWGRLLAAELLFLCLLGGSTLRSNANLFSDAEALSNSGGLIGWTIASLLSPIGTTGGMVLLSLCILFLLPLIFKMQLIRLQPMLQKQQKNVNDWRIALQANISAKPSLAKNTTGSTHPRAAELNNKPTTRAAPSKPVQPQSRASAPQPISGTRSPSAASRTRASANAPSRRAASTRSISATASVPNRPITINRAQNRANTKAASSWGNLPTKPTRTGANELPDFLTNRPIQNKKIANRADASASAPSAAAPTSKKPPRSAVPPTNSLAQEPTSNRENRSAVSTRASSAAVPANRSKSRSKSRSRSASSVSEPVISTSKPSSTAQKRSTNNKPSQRVAKTPPARASKPVAQAKKTSRSTLPAPSRSSQTANQAPNVAPNSSESEITSPAATKAKPKINVVVPVSVANKIKRDGLPPFDMLQQHKGRVDPMEGQEKARLIEETLEHFGVPATVVEINQGPRITQFGVEPGFIETTQRDGSLKRRKVKVNAIKALADDLALALAARSIRIQPRVPGRTYVGIELPNDEPETVTLHSVLTSQAYQKIKGDLVIALGRDVTGQPVAADISRMPHMLIAGATGAGKSVCINTIIASLLFNLGPDQLKLLLIDPKMVELVPYNGIPHLTAPVVTDMEKVVSSLSWALREMERRYSLLSEARKRNLQSYNKWAEKNGHDTLPYIVIIIDELADLMMVAADDVEQIICRLAQMARATGIHLILATQRPSVDVVTGLIKANIPTRISFAVASSIDSRVILDSTGAENLLGLGDMLYQASDASRLHRIQGCYVSDQELQDLVDYWLHATAKKGLEEILKDKKSTPQPLKNNRSKQLTEQKESSDKLLAKAIELLEQNQSISVTVLQRKLRISYTRAAQLIKELKKQGVIGGRQA